MAAYLNGRLEAERAHSPRECSSNVECVDCFEYVLNADEDYCHAAGCGEPLCSDCAQVVNDEPLCSSCFAKSQKAAIESLQSDPQIGDLFRLPKAA